MKFKVKVLMLLVSMLFSVLGVSAEIINGQYKIKNVGEEKYLTCNSGSFLLTSDGASASTFDVAIDGNGEYAIMLGDNYLKDDFSVGLVLNETKNTFTLQSLGNERYRIGTDDYCLYYDINMGMMGMLVFEDPLYLFGSDEYSYWEFEKQQNVETFNYKILMQGDVPDGQTVNINGTVYRNGDIIEGSPKLFNTDVTGYTDSKYSVEGPNIQESTTDGIDYDIVLVYHKLLYYKVILNDAPAGKKITVGSTQYGNGETFSSTTQLGTDDIKNYTYSDYRVETPVISENTTDNDVDYDITINYHKQYTYTVSLDGAPSGTKILFDGEEKANMEKLTIEYELTNDNVNDHVDAKLDGYDTQVSIYINNGNKFIYVEYTQVYTYTINFVDAPNDATVTVDGIDGTFDKDHNTFETTSTINGTNKVHPSSHDGYKVSVALDNANYTITITYVQGYDYTVHITVVPANSTGTFNIGVDPDPSHSITEGGSNLVDGSTFVSTNALTAGMIRPRESYSHLCYKVLDNEQHEVNITYVLTSSLQSGKYYRIGHGDKKLKAAPNEAYNSGVQTDINAVVDTKTDYNDLWVAESAGTYNYKYLRHANSGRYLGKLNNNTLTLVESTDDAGQFILNNRSLLEVSEEKYLTQGALTKTTTASAWNQAGEASITLTLNDYGYATTCMPFNFTVEGAEIYGTTDVHDYSDYTTLKVHQVEGVAQAGQGYIIKGEPRAEGEPQKTVTLTPTTSEADDEAESSMLGTLIRQTGVCTALGYDYYGFKGDEFVLASSENIPANKAVYIPASASSVMKMSISLDEGLTTDILGLTPDASAHQPIYDLQGRSCMSQSQKGLYIQNGRKMICR